MCKNRLLAFCIVVAMLFSNINVYAANDEAETYTSEQLIYIYNTYFDNMEYIEKSLCNDDNFHYWNMIEDTEEKKVYSWFIDVSSAILEAKPDEQKYIEMLSGIIYMQESSLAQQVANQTQFDDVKGDFDYAMDFIGICTSLFGIDGSDIAKNVSKVVEVIADGGEMLAKNSEQAKYYLSTVQSYTQMMYLLESIEKNAQIPQLRDAAKELKSIGNSILQKRLEYISASGENILSYEADFFMNNLFWELIKQTNDYKTDETVKWFVDGAKKIADYSDMGVFVFKAMILIGDLAFGTKNTFTRYQEMKAMADIAQALETSVSDLTIDNSPSVNTIGNIGAKCNYYNSLISVHARGEYLVYSLLMKDAGLTSNIKQIVEWFKDYEDTTQAWYDGKIQYLLLIESSVNEILNIPYYETVGEKPQLLVYDKDDAQHYNYHCKIERGTIDKIVNIDGSLELEYETIKEFDVTEETATNLEDLVESPVDKAYTYRITISDLSDKPGTTQTKYVTVSHDAQNPLEFYTDFEQSNLWKKKYIDYIEENKDIYYKYAIYDVDKDSTPEMILITDKMRGGDICEFFSINKEKELVNVGSIGTASENYSYGFYEFNDGIIYESYNSIIEEYYIYNTLDAVLIRNEIPYLYSICEYNVNECLHNNVSISFSEYEKMRTSLLPIEFYNTNDISGLNKVS
ncbi:MAG: hypothetical protein II998_02800 [Clostridia bacterium]|nr:hypothetical protein [Clostridia bacterium]